MNKINNLINQMYSFEEDPEKMQDMLSGRIAKENVLDPSISAEQLANQANNPLFVAPQKFANTELSDVETEAQKQTADNKLRRQFTQNTIQPDVSDYDTQKANLAFPDDMGIVESGKQTQRDWDTERNNVNALATPQNEYEKLQAKLQELRDLEAAQNETAAKYNFGAKAAGIIGDTLARYNTAAIQKNVKAPIQYSGPKLQEIMGMIGEVKAPGTASQRAELLKEYELLKKAQGGDLTPYQRENLRLREESLRLASKKEEGVNTRAGNSLDFRKQEKNELSDKQLESIASFDKVGTLISDIDSRYKQFEDKLGPYASKLENAKKWIPGDNQDPEYAAFQATVTDQLSQYIKSLSGLTVSDKERDNLLESVPTVNDKPNVFKSKLDELNKRLGIYKGAELSAAEKYQGKNIPAQSKPAPAAPVARKTVVQNKNRFDAETGEFLGKAK
jgi:hypothetical protein